MEVNEKRDLLTGIALLAVFIVWTLLLQFIDVQNAGVNGTEIGFATLNVWFHRITGVHMMLYSVTDWLGLVPVIICMCFGILGFIQLIKRRSLLKVDTDLLLLGIYYVLIVLGYMLFEMVPINYRPILIDDNLEASYPSSTTLLVLSVMPTLNYQAGRRIRNRITSEVIAVFVITFSLFMVIGRLISGVHWLSDIVGSVFLSFGLFMIYRFMVIYTDCMKTDL